MKKLINSPQEVVREALEGMEAAHANHLRISYDPMYIARQRRSREGQGRLGLGRRQRP